MRQDKERSIREQADLWKGYWCILACILLVGRVSYLTFFQNHIVSVYAAAQTEQKEDSSVQILQENLMEEIQIDDVQKMLDEIMDDHVFSVREALMNIINGEEPVSKETVRSFLYSLFFSDMENEKGLILKLLLVIFIAAVLAEFADVFGNGQAGSISFYIVYLALFTMLMENFSRLGSTLTNWLLGLMDFMKVRIERIPAPTLFEDVNISDDAIMLPDNHYFISAHKKDPGQREFCRCMAAKDIGEYNTCPHLCEYCYANTSKDTALANWKRHLKTPYAETITGK